MPAPSSGPHSTGWLFSFCQLCYRVQISHSNRSCFPPRPRSPLRFAVPGAFLPACLMKNCIAFLTLLFYSINALAHPFDGGAGTTLRGRPIKMPLKRQNAAVVPGRNRTTVFDPTPVVRVYNYHPCTIERQTLTRDHFYLNTACRTAKDPRQIRQSVRDSRRCRPQSGRASRDRLRRVQRHTYHSVVRASWKPRYAIGDPLSSLDVAPIGWQLCSSCGGTRRLTRDSRAHSTE